MRIRNVASGHTHHVNNVLGDRMPRCGEIVYPGRVKYGQRDFFSEYCNLLKKRGKWRGHSRHVIGEPWHRIDSAGDEV